MTRAHSTLDNHCYLVVFFFLIKNSSSFQLPLFSTSTTSTTADIVDVFLVRHSMVCNQLSRYSICTKNIAKTPTVIDESKANSKKSKAESKSCPGAPVATAATAKPLLTSEASLTPQTASTRTRLRAKYASAKLFQAKQIYISQKALEICVQPGDLVGVVQKKDPMGDVTRWYVDNGIKQGFLPSRVLMPIGAEDEPVAVTRAPVQPNVQTSSRVPVQAPAQVQVSTQPKEDPPPSYDDVAVDDSELYGVTTETTVVTSAEVHSYDNVAEEEIEAEVPPVPTEPPRFDSEEEGIYAPKSDVQNEEEEDENHPQPTNPSKNPEQLSHHSYEEIPPSEANSEVNSLHLENL